MAGELGYDVATRWPSYFAWRGAPLGGANGAAEADGAGASGAGGVSPRMVTSAFYSFSPRTVAEHVPAAWAVASPAQVLSARTRAADVMCRARVGLDPCESLVSFAAIGAAPQEVFASRGWTAAEWSAARDRLTARGWVDADGSATELGRDARDEIEWRTDRTADAPWQALGADRAQRLADLTRPLLGAAFESGLLPGQSTLGIANVAFPAARS